MTLSTWDARAMLHVGLMIERYLVEQPPPDGSVVARDLADWAQRLRLCGEADLAGSRALTRV